MEFLEETYLTVKQVAERLNADQSGIHRAVREGKIPSIRHGKNGYRIPLSELELYLRRPSDRALEMAASLGRPARSPSEEIEEFRTRVGMKPEEFLAEWKANRIEDTGETSRIAMEALAIRERVATRPQRRLVSA